MEELVAEAAPRRERRRRKGGAAAGAGGGSAAARVAYGDVFGGPPRFAAPFAGAPEDYADVFGGVAATCSIPFLDLPRAAGVVVAVGVVDYGEVFGRVDFGGFAVPYEELFAGVEVEREREEIASSSGSSRSSINNEPSQLETKPSVLSQHYPNVDRIQHFEEEQFSPISIPPDGEQRFSMSYNNMAQGGPDDLAGMATCVVEPSIHDMVDPCILSHESSTNHVPRMDNGNGVKGKSFLLSSANTSVRSSESDFMVDQKQHMPKCLPISENVCANEIHQNSGSHSASNDEAPFDYPFLRVSNDGLQTLPSKAPPPSRLPLKLHNTQESTAKGDIHLVNNKGTPASSVQAMSNSNTLQASKKVDPPLFDPDVNPSPTAAAAAAMKEAMEFADARLKAAKELMERKGDSFKLRKRSGHHRSTKSTEMKESKTPEEIPTFEEKLSVKKSSNEHKNNEDLALLDKHRNVSAVKLAHCDDNEKRVLPLEKPQQMMQSGIGLCQASSKFEKFGNGSSGDEFYELISHDRKCATNTATEEEGNGGGTSPATELSKDTTRNTGVSAGDSDLERYENLWEDNDSGEVGVKHVDLREDSIASMESDDKVPIIPESSVPAENLAHHQEIHGSHFRGKMRAGNIQESHDDDVRVARMSEMPSKLDFVQEISGSFSEACSSGEHVNDLRDLDDTSTKGSPVVGTSKEDYSNKEGLEMHCVDETLCTTGRSKNLQGHPEVSTFDDSMASQMKARNLEEPAESYECQASLRESSTADGEAETYEKENFSFVNETCLHNENKKIIEVPTEAPIYNKVEKFGTENTGPSEYSEEIGVDWNAECPEQENDITLENSSLANELEQSEVLNVFEVASKLIERKCGIFEKDPDQLQEKQGLLKPGELQGRTQGAEYIESDSKEKEASLEKSEMPAAEKILDHDGQEDQMASKTDANNEPSGLNAEGNVKIDEEGNALHSGVEVNINTANDYATRMSMNLKDVPTPFSEMYTIMHHLPPNADSVSAQAFDGTTPGLQEDCKKGAEREFLTERSTTFQEKKRTGSKMEEKEDKQKTPNVVLKDQKSPRLEKSSNIPKFVEDTASAFVKTSRKEAPVVHKTEERKNRSKIEREIEGKEVSRRLEEEKERERKLEKQRERKLEKQREQTKERERRILEEKEREKEREKDRLAVERATREAHQRAFAEARERAERVALERITAARQRASTEAREKEKARAGAAAEKASREARLKVERAAVERATAEARERAIEKAKAGKAAADARERMERSRPSFRESFKTTNQDTRQDAQSQRTISNDFKRSTNYSNQVVEVESALRYKARLERHQRTAERVTKALTEKNLRDMLAQREQAERHRLAEFLDPEVKRWSNGKEGNLRALLSTLQYILGSDSGWQPVPLTDLITAAAVKKAYRRATLCVHPDKLQQRGATVRQKYVCEKVFDLLKEAWNKFNSEER